MNRYLLSLVVALPVTALGQYATPGAGTLYTLDSLVQVSGGTVTGGGNFYSLTGLLFIAATDTLLVADTTTLSIDPDVLISIEGHLQVEGSCTFTCSDTSANYLGLEIEELGSAYISGATFSRGGGIGVRSPNFYMEHSTVELQDQALASSALNLTTGTPIIDHCTFRLNQSSAIASAANSDAAPRISYCSIDSNVLNNSNRPQINLGPSQADTTYILHTTVTGNPASTNAGGIAVATLVGGDAHVVISQCSISNNRYGIALVGSNIHSQITGNSITDNNTQDNPMLGGSGINLNGTSGTDHLVRFNTISNNIYGITTQGNAQLSMGHLGSYGPGSNTFDNNGFDGDLYALYNDTPNAIPAEGNCWIAAESAADEAEIAAVIFDQADDPSLGAVDFSEPFCETIVGIAEHRQAPLQLFPNPARESVTLLLESHMASAHLLNLSGQLLRSFGPAAPGYTTLNLSGLAPGSYLLLVKGRQQYRSVVVVQ